MEMFYCDDYYTTIDYNVMTITAARSHFYGIKNYEEIK